MNEEKVPDIQFRDLFARMNQGLALARLVFNDQGQVVDLLYLEANSAFEEQTGNQNLVGKRHSSGWNGSPPDWLAACSQTRQNLHVQLDMERMANGKTYRPQVFAAGAGGELIAITLTDVTNQQQAVGAVKQNEDRHAFLVALGDALRHLSDPVEMQAAATCVIMRHLACNRCYYGEIEQGKITVRKDASTAGLPSVAGTYDLDGMPIFKAVIEAGKPFLVYNILNTDLVDESLRALCIDLQVTSFINVPVIKSGKAVGMLCVVQSTPRHWSALETELAEEVAQRIWSAVERGRAQEALRMREEQKTYLLNLTDELRPLGDPLQVQQTALNMLCEYLDLDRAVFNELNPSTASYTNYVSYARPGFDPRLGSYSIAPFRGLAYELRAGQTNVVADVWAESRFTQAEKNYCQQINIGAFVVVPLIRQDQWIANLVVHHHEARQWTAFEIDLMEETATRCWAAAERARAERQLQASETKYRTLFDSIDEGYCIIQMLYDEHGKAIDWLFLQVNHAFELNNGLQNAVGKTIRELAPGIEPKWVEIYDRVAQSGVPLRFEEGSMALHRIFSLYAFRIGDPAERKVAVIFTDISAKKQSEQALRASEQRFRLFVAASSELVYRASPDWQQIFFLNAKDLKEDKGHPVQDWISTVVAPEDRNRLQRAINQSVSSHKMFELEHRLLRADGTMGWALSRAVPVPAEDGNVLEWLGTVSDITARKQAEEQVRDFTRRLEQEVQERTAELKESKELLRGTLDTSLEMIEVFKAIRDDSGTVVDFTWILNNHAAERVLGKVIGKRLLEEKPSFFNTVSFENFVAVTQSGQPQQYELRVQNENFDGWIRQSVVKLDDGVAATTVNITARKQADAERFRNLLLLEQAENLAALGSWEYDLNTGYYSWSDGMYRLFELTPGTIVEPEIYLLHATPSSLGILKTLVHSLKTGLCNFDETVTLEINGTKKVLRIKGTPIHNEKGGVVKMLGVDMDITVAHTADERIRQMETEQRLEIFRQTLKAQEEERRLISESLHNGLGQLLYGIKVRMSQLTQAQAVLDPEKFESSRQYTDELLADAIRSCRRISHELTPLMLEDFGLKAAVDDIGRQLGHGIIFDRRYQGLNQRMDRYLELAIYRMVQELMLNVVKHAKASHASVRITRGQSQVTIRVEDDGLGMEQTRSTHSGIGLATIQSKVKLLNGKIKISPGPTSGTVVEIRIPHPGAVDQEQ